MFERNHRNVVLCASFIVDPIQDYLAYWSKEFDQGVRIEMTPYNSIFQQLLDAKSLINQNDGINILLVRAQDWLRDKIETSSASQIDFLNEMYQAFADALRYSKSISVASFLIGIVPLSAHSFSSETDTHLRKINEDLASLLKDSLSFNLIDLNMVGRIYKVEEIFDSKADEIGHMPFTRQYYSALGTYLWRKIRASISPSYKVIAIDCDNTLWKGVCGEDGATNLLIDEGYRYFQEFLLEKLNEGFLLVLCSKNNENDVWEVFSNHPEMKLKQEDIAAYRINWEPKPNNLISIAKELNIGLDSFIFIDDSKFEIEQVSYGCPNVLTLNLPADSTTFFSFLNHVWEFDVLQVTEEDLQRNKMYKAEKSRKKELQSFTHLDDFLRDLNIEVSLNQFEEKELDRAVQLMLRTNQFNLNGIRKTREQISRSISDEAAFNQIIRVKDRFGDYGIVGLILAKRIRDSLVIDTFLLSCRVLGRKVEEFILAELQEYCAKTGLQAIIMNFQPTLKNKPLVEFLQSGDWIKDPETNSFTLLIPEKKHLLLQRNEG